ncbi:MAG: hypothetical protein ACXVFT_00215 [Solirubrobacteraceae bacterium]
MQAVGGVLGAAVVAGVAHRVRPSRLMGAGAVAFGVVSMALWNAPAITTAPLLYVAGFVVVGLPGAGYGAGAMAFLQARTDPAARGRVLSTITALEDGMQALGVLGAGVLAAHVPVVLAFSAQAGIWIAAGLLSLALLDRDGRAAAVRVRRGADRPDRLARAVAGAVA